MCATLSHVTKALTHPWIVSGGESEAIVELKATILLTVVQFHRLALKSCALFGDLSLAKRICEEVISMATSKVSPAHRYIELAAVCQHALLVGLDDSEETQAGLGKVVELAQSASGSPGLKTNARLRTATIFESSLYEYCSVLGVEILAGHQKSSAFVQQLWKMCRDCPLVNPGEFGLLCGTVLARHGHFTEASRLLDEAIKHPRRARGKDRDEAKACPGAF